MQLLQHVVSSYSYKHMNSDIYNHMNCCTALTCELVICSTIRVRDYAAITLQKVCMACGF